MPNASSSCSLAFPRRPLDCKRTMSAASKYYEALRSYYVVRARHAAPIFQGADRVHPRADHHRPSKGLLNNAHPNISYVALKAIGVPNPVHPLPHMASTDPHSRDLPDRSGVRNVPPARCRSAGDRGTQFPTIIEYYYKDTLGDPLIADEHIAGFGWARP